MKRVFLYVMLIALSNCILGQELTKQMCSVFKGQPKSITEGIQGTSETYTVQFDRDGKVLSKDNGILRYQYFWSTDNKSVEVKGYYNGQYQGSEMIYISEMSSDRYEFTTDGMSFDIRFRQNGSISQEIISGGGQTLTNTYYYDSSTDLYPNKCVTSQGGQSVTVVYRILETDYMGNCTKNSLTVNGNTIINETKIVYY